VILVLDSSALIALARIERLDLLPALADEVHIPGAVFEIAGPLSIAPAGLKREVCHGFESTLVRIRQSWNSCASDWVAVKLSPSLSLATSPRTS
jgi:hypothetical protein